VANCLHARGDNVPPGVLHRPLWVEAAVTLGIFGYRQCAPFIAL
jgi:hypothetical protein